MKMVIDRAIVEQTLEALDKGGWNMTAAELRAALAQQDEPVKYDRAAIAKAEGEQA